MRSWARLPASCTPRAAPPPGSRRPSARSPACSPAIGQPGSRDLLPCSHWSPAPAPSRWRGWRRPRRRTGPWWRSPAARPRCPPRTARRSGGSDAGTNILDILFKYLALVVTPTYKHTTPQRCTTFTLNMSMPCMTGLMNFQFGVYPLILSTCSPNPNCHYLL